MADYTTKMAAKKLLDSITDKTNIVIELYKEKDIKFVECFNLMTDDILNIVKNIDYNTVRSKIKCHDSRFDIDYLYDFKTIYMGMSNIGCTEIIPIYIKIGKDNLTDDTIIVVSLHEDE